MQQTCPLENNLIKYPQVNENNFSTSLLDQTKECPPYVSVTLKHTSLIFKLMLGYVESNWHTYNRETFKQVLEHSSMS